jgi:Kef-type K+ transport system membrane component KefB
MGNFNAETLLIVVCTLVVISYFFSIISKYVRIPSVLLLLFAGMAFREITKSYGLNVTFPDQLIESLGVVGLIMIVLEAGLDLKLGRDKVKLIRNSFIAALVILVVSTAIVTGILFYWLKEPIEKCIAYALPLSIMSSSIVLPSIHHLTELKKEFLVYEASFSDILGILFFNYFISGTSFTGKSALIFGGNILMSIVLSLVLSFILFVILAKTKLNIKFFLIFALLILIYTVGKILHLPSMIIILVFGVMINNWKLIRIRILQRVFPATDVESLKDLMHSITAESSFLIRTFFFFLFGYLISLQFLNEAEVSIVGGLIVFALFISRFLYLRYFLKTNLIPEMFFIPRGLVTIVLFYKIPANLRLSNFNDGILFFVIVTTSIIMAFGMIFYKKKPEQIVDEAQFSEHSDLI